MRKCKGVYYMGGATVSFEMGYFHGFGLNYEEFESGPGSYTVAIVELPDGRVIEPLADGIQFLDSPERKPAYINQEFEKVVDDMVYTKSSPSERTKNAVYATGNKWARENFNDTHN